MSDTDELRTQLGAVLRRWGLLDEVNDPAATEAFVVTDLMALLREPLAAGIRAAADEIAGIDFHPNARARSLDIATGLVHRLRRLADDTEERTP